MNDSAKVPGDDMDTDTYNDHEIKAQLFAQLMGHPELGDYAIKYGVDIKIKDSIAHISMKLKNEDQRKQLIDIAMAHGGIKKVETRIEFLS